MKNMFVSDCLNVNAQGHLTIGGADTVALAEKYGTPLYVMSEEEIRQNCKKFKSSIDRFYDGHGLVAYASKAFSCKEIYRIVGSEGLGFDVVSGGELYTALQAGVDPKTIYFHGNNKTTEELAYALESGVGRIVVDNLTELGVLEKMAKAAGKTADILFRIKPGIDAHTHAFIRTGQIDSKFGMALENGEAMEAVREVAQMGSIRLCGVHCHIGSQIFDIDPFELAAEVMIDFMADIKEETGLSLHELNLGGGFGIKYLPEHEPSGYDQYMERVSKVIKATCEKREMPVPFVIIEPGRSIVGAAGITLYTVGSIKEIKGVRTYLAIDGGMTDNPRYALYHSDYDAVVANHADQPREMKVTIAGKCCESGDLIQEDITIQKARTGDILAVLSTGAYNYSMSSNYNRLLRPAVVMVQDGEDRLIVKRETYEDVVRNDL